MATPVRLFRAVGAVALGVLFAHRSLVGAADSPQTVPDPKQEVGPVHAESGPQSDATDSSSADRLSDETPTSMDEALAAISADSALSLDGEGVPGVEEAHAKSTPGGTIKEFLDAAQAALVVMAATAGNPDSTSSVLSPSAGAEHLSDSVLENMHRTFGFEV
ncbi:hypothetical protein BESB_023230 [Besnoitia besnoiti]|uniref:Secreted protein n=1 Tax=Besnoitia besnoiti TaxID=94643 RepID=A0A2A9M693_BESBE|nr:hypothetical protein BESB_023230 [Besnoitia besnoiti]PFH31831.1 hypothetical protein BESB_023230 [Besnoitia besnoiti]